MSAVFPYLADALVVFGVLIMTIGVYGVIRMPDTYTRLHAASKVVVLGLISLLAASTVTGDPAFLARVALIGAFLLLTTPVSAHVIGKAAYQRHEKMRAQDAVDESESGLAN